MAMFDLDLDRLQEYRPTVVEPEDFDGFWSATLTEAQRYDLDPRFDLIDVSMPVFDTYDVTFTGFGGARVKGWMITPAGAEGPLPAVVEYLGYSGGRGLPIGRTVFAAAGWAHVIMDTRGQGWNTGGGEGPPRPPPGGGAPPPPGVLTPRSPPPPGHHHPPGVP